MTMSTGKLVGVWAAIFVFIAIAIGSLAYSSEDQYSMPSAQFEQGIIPPFHG